MHYRAALFADGVPAEEALYEYTKHIREGNGNCNGC
jgi:hypothetical protein